MNSLRTVCHFVIALALMCFVSAHAADSNAPDAVVRATVDEVLAAIKQTKDPRALRELAEQKVVPHFDFKRMTQLAVGAQWRQATPAQQQELENAFRTLLVNTYTNALSTATTGSPTVDIKPAQSKPGQDETVVRTVVKQSGKEPVSIDYRMEKAGDGWKVFDVTVENLSLVTNYRDSFASEISRSGVDGLIKVLQEKNRANAKT